MASQQKISSSAIPENDVQFRGQLAQVVTMWALAAVAVIGVATLLPAAWTAVQQPTEEKVREFLMMAKDVLGMLLPVIGVWVGTVLAFYFGKENFETASRSITAAARVLTSQEKLAATLVGDLGKQIEVTAHLRLAASDNKETFTLDRIESAFKVGSQLYERLPVLQSTGAPYMVLHRSTLNDFLLQRKKLDKDKESRDYKLSDLFTSEPWLPDKSFAVVGPDSTAAQAKSEMEKLPNCTDVFVTDKVTGRFVSRWITNIDLLEAANV